MRMCRFRVFFGISCRTSVSADCGRFSLPLLLPPPPSFPSPSRPSIFPSTPRGWSGWSGGRAGLKGRRLPPLGCLGVLRGERVEKGGKVRGEGGEGCKVWWCCVEDAQSGTNRAFLDKGKPTNVFAPSFFVDGAAWWCLVRLFFWVLMCLLNQELYESSRRKPG